MYVRFFQNKSEKLCKTDYVVLKTFCLQAWKWPFLGNDICCNTLQEHQTIPTNATVSSFWHDFIMVVYEKFSFSSVSKN